MAVINPYAEFLDTLDRPGRYIGGEHFSVNKKWHEQKLHLALAFPDVYEIGMAHLGYKILYEEINKIPDILADRVFAPWPDLISELKKRELPLVSLEHAQSLNKFEVVGFSLQYELTYTNILTMLETGGIPIWSKDRGDNETIVFAGGPCATHPEPIAPFIDAFLIGDGETLLAQILQFILDSKEREISRQKILKGLADFPGVYVPSIYSTKLDPISKMEIVDTPKKIKRFFIKDLNDFNAPTTAPIPHLTAIFDRFSIELARGCTEGCRFCQAGMIYRPVRERSPHKVIEQMMEGIDQGGFKEASITCLSTADYSAVTPLLLDLIDKMQDKKVMLGLPSLRAYGLDKKVYAKLAKQKNITLTFAPEAGTQRLRNVINKNVTDQELINTACHIFSLGWKKMKLYFMIGLPSETDDDIKGIANTTFAVRQAVKKVSSVNPIITISASTFVPKPHTPFQWSEMISLNEINRRQEILFVESRKRKVNFKKHNAKSSVIEAAIARGDRQLSKVIYSAWKSGAIFDSWSEHFNFDVWVNSFLDNDIDINNYLAAIPSEQALPWDHIDVGLDDKFLKNEWQHSLKERNTPPCAKPANETSSHLICYQCGLACNLDEISSRHQKSKNMLEQKPTTNLAMTATTDPTNPAAHLYRINFAKIGAISFISHLDLQKVMARIFRRAHINIATSKGFNPRPLLSFGPALPVGISSLNEHFDVKIDRPWGDFNKALKRLQENAERGIYFKGINTITSSSISIQESIKFFQYFIPLQAQDSSIIKNLLKMTEFKVERYIKKSRKRLVVDVAPSIEDIVQGELDISSPWFDLVKEVSPQLQPSGLILTVKVIKGSSIRPRELKLLFSKLGLNIDNPLKIDQY